MSRRITAGVSAVLLVILTVMVTTGNAIVTKTDNLFANFAASTVNPVSTILFKIIKFLASPAFTSVLMLALVVYLFYKRSQGLSVWLAISFFGGSAIAWVIKHLVRRPRPAGASKSDDGFSFPSGHVLCAAMLVILALVILYHNTEDTKTRVIWTIVGCVWILLVMFDRVYLQAHHITDTLASVLLASCWLGLTYEFRPQELKTRRRYY